MAKQTKLNRTYHFRMTDDQRELLARRAYSHDPKNQSIQAELEREVFGSQSKNELEVLRGEHRRLGIPDSKFLHTRKLKSMGYRVRYGRRKQIVAPSTNGHNGTQPPMESLD